MALTKNALVNVNSTKVGLGWGVTDDVTGAATAYAAVITVTLPERADAGVIKTDPNETVVLNRSARLTCGPDGIEANVTYRVSPREGAKGRQVAVKVVTGAGQKSAATGDVLGEATGQVGEDISVHVVVPGSCR
jgi:hypothetical protein